MTLRRIGLLAAGIALAATAALAQTEDRSAYSYVRESSGGVTVISGLNGSVEARRNLPISGGDEVQTDEPGRAEIALADGNVLHVGGGTKVQLVSLYGQQGSEDQVSVLSLRDGSIVLSVVGSDEKAVPRIDTEGASIYTNLGARVRVNSDPRRGTAVVVRAGSVEVRCRTGSYTVRAGSYLLVQGDEEPEIARGSFSRDRFDIWVSDRLEATYEAPRNASSQYVGEDHASDVASLDGYGNWDYNTTSSSYVWRPTVATGWTPYSYGSWYYTPIGLTWWSSDPWGWYPFHYGNWFFDTGWNSWCWSPGHIYSPAWVYWAYTSAYVGWCPMGWYGPFSPWWNTYHRNWDYPRASLAFAINGRFSTRRVDLRGWNFTGSTNIGVANGRMPITPGTRAADRLGSQIAISSRPIVVSPRAGVGVRESLRDYIRQAPAVIERGAGRDAARLEPVLARERTLPQSAVQALRERTVSLERGRLTGPGAMDLAPRGATVVERDRGAVHLETNSRAGMDRAKDRAVITDRNRAAEPPERGRAPQPADRGSRVETAKPEASDSWRARTRTGETGRSARAPGSSREPGTASREARPEPGRQSWRNPSTEPARPRTGAARPEAWRENPRSAPAPRSESFDRRESWRSRSEVPPARRVIEGAVPGHRGPEARQGDAPRPREFAPRDYPAPRGRGYAVPAPREAPAPREMPRSIERGPSARDAAPPSRSAPPSHSAPAHRSAPPPRSAPPTGSSHPGRP